MKIKLLFLALLLLGFTVATFAQHKRGTQVRFKNTSKTQKEELRDSYSTSTPERVVEVGLTYNYQFGGKVYGYYGSRYSEFRFSDSESYGITLSFPTKWNTRLEIAFANQNTTLSGDYNFGSSDVAVRYYQIGVVKEISKGKMIPYGAFSVGAVELNPDEKNFDEIWKFALTLGGGLKYYFTKNIGLKLEGRMMVPIAYGGLYFGTGGSGVSASSATVQGYIGAGVTFALTK
jgi:opacity protein-like surface antigen